VLATWIPAWLNAPSSARSPWLSVKFIAGSATENFA
jgi:hypothetical protein